MSEICCSFSVTLLLSWKTWQSFHRTQFYVFLLSCAAWRWIVSLKVIDVLVRPHKLVFLLWTILGAALVLMTRWSLFPRKIAATSENWVITTCIQLYFIHLTNTYFRYILFYPSGFQINLHSRLWSSTSRVSLFVGSRSLKISAPGWTCMTSRRSLFLKDFIFK